MTLQASPPISLLDVRQELAIGTLPFSLDHPDVRRLGVKPSGALSLTDLLGKERGWWGVLHASFQIFDTGSVIVYDCGYASSVAFGSLDSTSGSPYFPGSTIVSLYAWSIPANSDGGMELRFSDGSAITSVPGTPSLKVQIVHPTTFQVLDERTLLRGVPGGPVWSLNWGATGTVPAFFTAAGDYVITVKWA